MARNIDAHFRGRYVLSLLQGGARHIGQRRQDAARVGRGERPLLAHDEGRQDVQNFDPHPRGLQAAVVPVRSAPTLCAEEDGGVG